MTQPLLCETVTARTLAELRAARDAVTDADVVELRLDGVQDPVVAGALEGRRLPVVVTCRPRWEGGLFDGSEEEREALLEEALARGADYVDVEWRAGFASRLQAAGGTRILLSMHDFQGVPGDLGERVRQMRATGAGVVKVAVTTPRLRDTLSLLNLARDASTVVIGMGACGIATRVLAERYGSCWSYAGAGVAPGQMPASRMTGEFRFRRIQPSTAVYGVVGNPVLHSLSPRMHNAVFDALGIDAVYLPLQAADFDDFLVFAERLGLAGSSVTIPFKRDALRCAQHVDPTAAHVGAVNTLRRTGGVWEGTNTDVEGFLEPLYTALGVTDSPDVLSDVRVSVLGAGGVARAVVAGLVSKQAQVTVHARVEARGRALAETFRVEAGAWPPRPGAWDVLVNCTPLGSPGRIDESPMEGARLDGRLVYDLVYTPAETRLLREARAAGCHTLGGLPMLVAQAERQMEWWTGRQTAPGVMREAAAGGLSG